MFHITCLFDPSTTKPNLILCCEDLWLNSFNCQVLRCEVSQLGASILGPLAERAAAVPHHGPAKQSRGSSSRVETGDRLGRR